MSNSRETKKEINLCENLFENKPKYISGDQGVWNKNWLDIKSSKSAPPSFEVILLIRVCHFPESGAGGIVIDCPYAKERSKDFFLS